MHRSIFDNTEKAERFIRFVWAVVLISVALGWITNGHAAGQTRGPQPEVALDASEHDFGDIFLGESLSHAFTVRNTGGAPLELSQKVGRSGRPALVYASYTPQ